MKNISNTFIISLAIIIATLILGNAWKKSHQHNQIVSVTGSAKENFESDLIVWKGAFSEKSSEMKEAYTKLKKDAEILKKYLLSKGVKENEIVFSSVNIKKEYETLRDKDDVKSEKFTGYKLLQSVKIESKEVNKIEAISREVTELIDAGVEFYSLSPEYYYTKLAELKIKMLSAATSDARLRAEKIAENAKSKLDKLKSANMGTFQITAQNSSEDSYTYGGAYNTSSKMKTASITVHLEFGIE